MLWTGSPGEGRESAAADGGDVTNTVVIAVCSVVAYLGLVVGLTVYCSLRLVRRLRRRRKRHAADDRHGPTNSRPSTHSLE